MATANWPMTLEPSEPGVAEWTLAPFDALVAAILGRPAPRIIAVDGRSASGKSTLGARLAEQLPDAALVHTDDLAWNEPFFAWGHLLREAVLRPARRGEAVSFTPPAWATHGRTGSIEVPAGVQTLIVEGVGASHVSTVGLVDLTIWVQSDRLVAERRGLARDIASGENGDAAATQAFWDEWDEAECRYLAEDRPWQRADLIVAGTTPVPLPEGTIAVAAG